MSELDKLRIDSPVAKPRRKRGGNNSIVFIIILLAAAGAWYFWPQISALRNASGPNESVDDDESDAQDGTGTTATTAGPAGSFSAAGYLEVIPPGPRYASSLVSARVLNIKVVPGEQVEEGDLVAVLDSSLYEREASILASRLDVANRELELQQAGFRSEEKLQTSSDLDRAKSERDLRQKEYDRAAYLYREGVISQSELDTSQSALSQSEAAIRNIEARMELLNAGQRKEDIAIYEARADSVRSQLADLYWKIKQCEIFAPAAGVVYELYVSEGNWVTPGTESQDSGSIASIFDPSMIQAWVDVNQRDSANLLIGQRAELATDAHPQRIITGTVHRIMPQANLQKNTVRAKIALDEVPEDFRPELSVKVTFLPADKAGATGETGSTEEAALDEAEEVTNDDAEVEAIDE